MGRNSLKSFASYAAFKDQLRVEKQKSIERRETREAERRHKQEARQS